MALNNRIYFNRQTAGSAGYFPVQIPRFMVLNDKPEYAEIVRMSNDAKMLYALMLYRLSENDQSIAFLEKPLYKGVKEPVQLNGGYDEHGNAYIHFCVEAMQEQLALPKDSAVKALCELKEHSMILLTEQSADEPYKIYPLSPIII
jgi:hypothetical protein